MNHPTRGTIDNLGRISLPAKLLQKQKWCTGDKIELSNVNGTIVLQLLKSSIGMTNPIRTIDELGRINLPATLRQIQNWGIGNEVAISGIDDVVVLAS